MRNTEFVESIKKYVRDTALSDTIEFIENLPGRKPRKRHVELSNWYNSLSGEDKQKIGEIMAEAVDSSLFGFLCVLDGARTIEKSDKKTTFELYAVKGGGSTRVNSEEEQPLHDIYNALTNSVDQ
ncbi:hypothetical protein OS242_21030 [Tumebacillus sp. DT12]|uniref:Uncharacterized protein n=1 Tax=Tumebacillus lacus TaxID=2995335 RepID=A0ABT3X8U3_9BACL|nr:hypothetical protein [Tumebacillus lacus]MCX7572397.1 hypothetical protein [Tumebacillus lacus]